MVTTYTRKQRDKFGNVWLRDKYGGWTNEFGVRFTKSEHQKFGYAIRKANEKIQEYLQKYPYAKQLKTTDIGDRLRSSDLARFRQRSAYKNYLRVTKGIISGYQLYRRMPTQYRDNYTKSLHSDNIIRMSDRSPEIKKMLDLVLSKISKLSPDQLIKMSRDPKVPEINENYIPEEKVVNDNLQQLINYFNTLEL